ncbi:unnamed protein product [Calypogeia fissa]
MLSNLHSLSMCLTAVIIRVIKKTLTPVGIWENLQFVSRSVCLQQAGIIVRLENFALIIRKQERKHIRDVKCEPGLGKIQD